MFVYHVVLNRFALIHGQLQGRWGIHAAARRADGPPRASWSCSWSSSHDGWAAGGGAWKMTGTSLLTGMCLLVVCERMSASRDFLCLSVRSALSIIPCALCQSLKRLCSAASRL